MEEEAISKIERMAITKVQEVFGYEPFAILPEQAKAVSIKDFKKEKTFKQDFNTSSIDDFVAYIKHHQDLLDNSFCYVDQDRMKAEVIFDEGVPGKPDDKNHTSTLQLQRTEAYNALRSMHGEKLSQKEVADWLQDWKNNLTCSYESVEIGFSAALKAVRDMTVEKARSRRSVIGDASQSMSAMEEIEAKSEYILPDLFIFKCAQFHGLPEQAFGIHMSIDFGQGECFQFKFRVASYDLLKEQASKSFKEVLTEKLAEIKEINPIIGTI